MNHKLYTPSSNPAHAVSRRRFGTGIAGLASFAAVAGMRPNVAHAASETQWVPLPVMLPVEVISTLDSQSLKNDQWMCSVSSNLANHFGLGSHLRVRRDLTHHAIYTVAEVRDQDPDNTVRMGKNARKRMSAPSEFEAVLLQALSTRLMTDTQAEDADEFVERIADTPNNQGLLIMAPHGGDIEGNTDIQARWVADALPGPDVSTWICSGWRANGSTHNRWHVSTRVTNPVSFPGLASIADRGFAYAVAFHGMKKDGVLIGGAAPQELKQMVRAAIKSAVGNQPVSIAGQNDHNSGASPENVVNWITAGGNGGIQLEQSMKIRQDYWSDVAQAIVELYADLI